MLKRSHVEYCHPAQAGEHRVMAGPWGLVGITLYIRKTMNLKSSEATMDKLYGLDHATHQSLIVLKLFRQTSEVLNTGVGALSEAHTLPGER